jgi:cytochrome P450 family 142 subfamily A polypeptide 1
VNAPAINVLDPEFYVDPWEAYRWLRDESPVHWDDTQQLWAISRYDDIVDIEKRWGRYSSHPGSRPHIDLRQDLSMINLDDPDHQQQRGLVARRFTPRAVRDHEDHVRQVVTEILDAVTPLGECEVIESIASRLPAIMVGELLGYPPEMWEQVRFWSERVMHLAGQTDPAGPPHVTPPEVIEVMTDFFRTTLPLVHARRAEPRDDLISVWAGRPGWDDKHVLDEVILVLNGGAETTRTVIGSIMRELAVRPDQRRLLRDDPSLLPIAVEEFIRWVSPVLNMSRHATEDHELHGKRIAAGDQFLLLYPSANRDPRAFDRPDDFDVSRPHNRHVAFGFGAHFCLGAQLARLEIRVLFEELLCRMPDWELVDPDEPRIVPATFARAYDRIRIRFTPS